jgi:putative hydrolase of HD superfamily
MQNDRLKRQINFIIEMDKLKSVFRHTHLIHDGRKENDAEHSWHIAMMTIVLSEYADTKGLDILRTVKMLLIHDIVEIDAGDTFFYDKVKNRDKGKRERIAAERLFNLLPKDQAHEFHDLWLEFEERKSLESQFAYAMDRLQPLLYNYGTEGISWKNHQIQSGQVIEKNSGMQDVSASLWNYAKRLIDDAVERGYLEK